MHASPLASRTVGRHLLRGVLGLAAAIAAVAGAALGVPALLALLAVTVVAWRGCPTCWAVGLGQTRERAACPVRR